MVKYLKKWIKTYPTKIIPMAINEALLDIIDRSRRLKKISVAKPTIKYLFFIIPIKYKTKGIFNAIEKAVIFLFAVTPFKLSAYIDPVELIISIA